MGNKGTAVESPADIGKSQVGSGRRRSASPRERKDRGAEPKKRRKASAYKVPGVHDMKASLCFGKRAHELRAETSGGERKKKTGGS